MTFASKLSAAPASRLPRGCNRSEVQTVPYLPSDDELDTVNEVVAASIGSWELPARVRRLALPSLLYNEADLKQMSVVMLEQAEGGVAVAAWETAADRDAVTDLRPILLHGLYVVPKTQNQGLGTALLELASHWALVRGFDGITARVWRESETFFRNRGFDQLTRPDAGSYPLQMWRALQ